MTCRTHGCVNHAVTGGEFCYPCEATMRRELRVLDGELSEVLARDAAFISWCEEHGEPNPHE